jgi:hypothetical protein
METSGAVEEFNRKLEEIKNKTFRRTIFRVASEYERMVSRVYRANPGYKGRDKFVYREKFQWNLDTVDLIEQQAVGVHRYHFCKF